jgi:hypothetical protein
MNTAIAIRTLDALASGTDPISGAVLPDASPYNQPLVLRSLYVAIKVLQQPQQPVAKPSADSQRTNEPSAAQALPVEKTAEVVPHPQLEAAAKKRKPPRQPPANAGKAWSEEEDKQLCAEFDSGLAVKELAVKHSRSAAALNARLYKLGKIADPGFPLRIRPATV